MKKESGGKRRRIIIKNPDKVITGLSLVRRRISEIPERKAKLIEQFYKKTKGEIIEFHNNCWKNNFTHIEQIAAEFFRLQAIQKEGGRKTKKQKVELESLIRAIINVNGLNKKLPNN